MGNLRPHLSTRSDVVVGIGNLLHIRTGCVHEWSTTTVCKATTKGTYVPTELTDTMRACVNCAHGFASNYQFVATAPAFALDLLGLSQPITFPGGLTEGLHQARALPPVDSDTFGPLGLITVYDDGEQHHADPWCHVFPPGRGAAEPVYGAGADLLTTARPVHCQRDVPLSLVDALTHADQARQVRQALRTVGAAKPWDVWDEATDPAQFPTWRHEPLSESCGIEAIDRAHQENREAQEAIEAALVGWAKSEEARHEAERRNLRASITVITNLVFAGPDPVALCDLVQSHEETGSIRGALPKAFSSELADDLQEVVTGFDAWFGVQARSQACKMPGHIVETTEPPTGALSIYPSATVQGSIHTWMPCWVAHNHRGPSATIASGDLTESQARTLLGQDKPERDQ